MIIIVAKEENVESRLDLVHKGILTFSLGPLAH